MSPNALRPPVGLSFMVVLRHARIRGVVVVVSDLLQPVDTSAVQLLDQRDVRHGCRRRGAVPVLLARRTPDHVARADDRGRSADALYDAASSRDDENLPERMRVPRAAGA